MAHIAQERHVASNHEEAVALPKEMAACLRLPIAYVQDLARQVTGRPWEELDGPGAEAVVDLLAEALHRTLAMSSTPTA